MYVAFLSEFKIHWNYKAFIEFFLTSKDIFESKNWMSNNLFSKVAFDSLPLLS